MPNWESDPASVIEALANTPKRSWWDRQKEYFGNKYVSPLVQALSLPGDVYSGKTQVNDPATGHTNPEVIERSADLTGLLALGGVGMAEPGAAGIFGGRLAKTADHAALAKAEMMERQQATRTDIRDATGWFRGADGQWRFEIPDHAATYDPSGPLSHLRNTGVDSNYLDKEGWRSTIGEVFDHPELFKAYPELAEKTFQVNPVGKDGAYLGRWYDKQPWDGGSGGGMTLANPTSRNLAEGRSTGLHELQHGVQEIENFARGGNVEAMAGEKIPNPRLKLFEEASKSDPQFLEWRALRDSPEHAKELAEYNAIFRRNFSPRIQALEGQITDDNYGVIGPQIDAILKEYEAAMHLGNFPTMARHDTLAKALRERNIPLGRPPEFLSPEDAYKALAGETEARNVQRRRDMTPSQLEWNAPWTTEDVPRDQQIVRRR